MPSAITLMNGKKVYATQEPPELMSEARKHTVIATSLEGKPPVYVVVANIATITEGTPRSGKASF